MKWLVMSLSLFLSLFLSGCLETPPPENVDPVEWQTLQAETRLRAFRLTVLAAQVNGKIDPEAAEDLVEKGTDAFNCIQRRPECKLPDLPNVNDPMMRLKLVNELMSRLEADFQSKLKKGG